MSYIVKNCPALIKEAFQNNQIDGIATTTQISKNLCFSNTCIHCQDCTDCVIKQVIEKCKDMASDKEFYAYDFANEILQLFDIEEINK